MPEDDICYVGSESAERADGRAAVTALLTNLFARPEAYSRDVRAASIFTADGIAYLSCEATGRVHTDDPDQQSFPYRLSGLLQHTSSGWRWRACHGCEPAPTPPTTTRPAAPDQPHHTSPASHAAPPPN
jgi:SnoaL-like domain